MTLRDAFARLLTRSETPPPASPGGPPGAARTEGAQSSTPPAAPPSTVSTLAPWGNQWPSGYGARFLAENLAAVTACVQAIAGGIASLPAAVFRRLPDGKRVELPDHPVARLIRQPNPLQSWADWIEWLIASALLQGNAVSVVDHDGAGRPSGLYPIPWWSCQPILIPSSGATSIGSPIVPNSRLVFDVTMTMMPWPLPGPRPANGYPIRYFADEVIFLRDRSDDGILGRSRLSRSPEALACGLGAQGFSSNVWMNGAMLGGIISHPGQLSKEARDRMAQSWRDTHAGPQSAGKISVLEEGMKFERSGVSPEDAELLESRAFSVIEICRLFGVPPPIAGDWSDATFSNTASAQQWFGSLTLLPWVNKVEREFSRVVFNDPDVQLSIDLSGMLRGDHVTLAATDVALVRSGIISANEARRDIGLDPRDGADELEPQAVGGRPAGAADEAGSVGRPDSSGTPSIITPTTNGSGRGNGAARA